MQEVFGPINRIGDTVGLKWTPRGRRDPRGVQARLRQVRRGRLAGPERRGRVRRRRVPRGGAGLRARVLDGGQRRADHGPGLTTGAIELPPGVGHRGAEGDLPPQARHRRVDRHDEPHRAAGRLRRRAVRPPRPCRRATAPTRSPARRSSSPSASTTWPTTSSTWCWPALPEAPAGHQGHLAVHRAQVPGERRRHARRAQRRPLRVDRAQDGHPRLPHLRHELRRRRRRDRLPRRRGEPGHARHVHDDEPRAPRGGHAGRRASATRAYQKALAYAQERVQGREIGGDRREPVADHRAPRRAPDAAVHEEPHRGDARAHRLQRGGHRLLPEPLEGDAAERWHEIAELLTPVTKAWCTDVGMEVTSTAVQVFGGMGFIEESGRRPALPRHAHRPDLRGHQRHPGHGPRRPQAADAHGRRGQRPLRPHAATVAPSWPRAGDEFASIRAELAAAVDDAVGAPPTGS